MDTMDDPSGSTLDGEEEVREIAGRLRRLADRLIERSKEGDSDSLELLTLGVAMQRASFQLRSELAGDAIDLRDRSDQA